MTFPLSAHSVAQRATLHPLLKAAIDDALEMHDCRIETGARLPQAQQACYDAKPRTSKWPGFNSDGTPAPYPHRVRDDGTCWAVDLIPIVNGKALAARAFGVDPWETSRWTRFIGMVESSFAIRARAHAVRYGEHFTMRTGINWDRDAVILDEKDRKFIDAYHVEMELVTTESKRERIGAP